jgi:hypothetical protein
MALLDFPTGPQLNDTTTQNGNTWKWNGTSWVAFNNLSLSSQVTGILAVQYGGTGFGGTYTKGDILYATSSNTFAKLAAGSGGSILAIDSNKDLYWKIDDAGSGSVGSGQVGGLAYYTSTTNITSGTAFSYINATSNVVVKDGLLSLIGSTINSGTWAGNAVTLPYGGTNNTISGIGHSYRVAMYDAAGTAITNIPTSSGIANSVLFQSTFTTAPIWQGQSQLIVGGATTAANIQGGIQYNVVYQSNANTTGFVGNAAGSGASVLTQTGNNIPVYLGQSQLIVGGATTAANIQGGLASQLHYQTGANTTGFVANATGSGASILSQTGSAAPIYLGQSQLVVGGATTSANIQGGVASQILYQSSSNTTAFVSNATGSGASVLTQTGSAAPVYFGQSQLVVGGATTSANIQGGGAGQIAYNTAANTTTFLAHPGAGYALTSVGTGTSVAWQAISTLAVTSLNAGNGINVSGSTGAVTVSNIGVTSITGTANRITVTSSLGSSNGAITLNLPQDITTTSTPTFANITIDGGTSSTLVTVGSQPTSMVNKQYVDNLASGLDIHASVRVVITAAIGASYYQPGYGIGNTATGAYLTSIGNSTLLAYDGVTIGSTGISQRVLVVGGLTATGKTSINGSALVTPADSNLVNGIYYVGSVGSGSSQWYLYRATDTDDNTELTGGTFTFVEEGTTYKDSAWVCTNDTTNLGPIQFGSTAVTFTQFAGAAAFTSGQGLTKVGNTFATNVNLSPTGAASGIGYSQFNIGGQSVGGVADTGYYPTFSVRTSGTTVSGSALLTLNSDGFSLVGSTNTPRTLTVTGGDITLNGGGGNTLTLSGSISLPAPNQYALAFGTSATALGFLPVGTASSVLFQTNNTANPTWVGQNTLVVGGATTAANIQGGTQGALHYQSSVSTTGFISYPGAGYALTSVGAGTSAVWQTLSTMTVGNATTSGTATSSVRSGVVDLVSVPVGTLYLTGNTTATGANSQTLYTSGTGVTFDSSSITATTFRGNATTAGTATSALRAGLIDIVSVPVGTLYLTGSTVNTGTNSVTQYTSGTGVSFDSNSITATTFRGSLSGTATTATRVGITSNNTSSALPLVFADAHQPSAALGSTVSVTVNPNTSTITATNFSGLASSSSQVVTTADTTNTLYLLGTRTSGGTSGTIVYVDSSVSVQGVQVTAGVWAGTAVSLARGGTSNTIAGNGHSSKVAVYDSAGTSITSYSITQGNIIFGATGGTFAGLASTLLPVSAISDAPPAQPGGAIGATQPGQLWWDSQYGVLKIFYNDGNTSQWVDATPVLGSSGGGSSVKRSYVMTFGAGFTPSTGADTVQIQVPYAPDNTAKYYYIKRLDYRNETVSTGAGVSFFIDRHTTGNASFSSANRIHSGSGLSFVASAGIYITSYTLSGTGASFVSSSGVAGSVISGDYLRLNFAAVNSAATLSVSVVLEEQ